VRPVMFDVVKRRAERPALHSERIGQRFSDVSNLQLVCEASPYVLDAGAVTKRPPHLRAQVGSRIASDRNVVDVARRQPCFCQAPGSGKGGESRAVLYSVEPLFLRGSDEFSVDDERRRGIAVVCVESEDCGHCVTVSNGPGS
jgi:hypothetical protein